MEGDAMGGAAAGGIGGVFMLVWLAIFVLMLVSVWKVFTKAGQPGWASLIPIYNAYIFLKIAGKPGWWLILLLIPVVNLVIMILALAALSSAFGKGGGFTVGLLFLPIVFYPILAFGNAQYTPPPPA